MYQEELKVARFIAQTAGDIMLRYFDADQQLNHKDDASEVTIADTTINSMVIAELGKHFDDGVIGEEESTTKYGLGRKWICDPIDGTKAFVLGVPTSMFSLALVVDGIPVLGVLYDPFLKRFYYGIKGQGSYCNGVKLAVSSNGIKGHYVGVSTRNEGLFENPGVIKKLVDAGAKLDTTHGAVYKSCLVARGKTVGYMEKLVDPHDVAAAHIVVEEAGGMAVGYDGKKLDYSKPFKGVIISNKVAFSDLLGCIVK